MMNHDHNHENKHRLGRHSWSSPKGSGGPSGHRGHRGGDGSRRNHGGEGGGGHGGRYFDRGDLRLVLLSLIAEKPRYGYELIRSISESSGGVYRPSPGVIYPTLTLLEDLGHVRTSVDDSQRRLHEITIEGQAYLSAHRVTLEAMRSRIPGRRSPEVQAQIGEVRAAMETLKQALRSTLAAGPVGAARLARTVAVIAQAARDIAAGDDK